MILKICVFLTESMDNLKKEIRGLRVRNLQEYGILICEEELEMKLFSEDKDQKFRKFNILFFNQFLVAIELQKTVEFVKAAVWGFGPEEKTKIVKKFFDHYRIKEFGPSPALIEGNSHYYVEIKTFKMAELQSKKSLKFSFKRSEQEKARKFKDRIVEMMMKTREEVID